MAKRKKKTTVKRKQESEDSPPPLKKAETIENEASSTSHIEEDIDHIQGFTSVSLLNKSDINDQSHYWCNYCSFSTDLKKELISHMREHMHKCPVCSFSSLSQKEVAKHSRNEHDKDLDLVSQETEPSNSCEMDKDPCSSCVFCDFMTYSTEHLERHTLSKHPGLLAKSVAKMITKQASAQIRRDDALFYFTIQNESSADMKKSASDLPPIIIEVSDDKNIKEIKSEANTSPSDLTRLTKKKTDSILSSSITHEDKSKSAKEDITSSGNALDWKVKVETLYCLTCPYSNAYIEKLKCHTLSQHPLGPAVCTYNTSPENSSDQDITFFCVREDCSYNTIDSKSYQRHLMDCCSCRSTLTKVEKDRLEASIVYVLSFQKKFSKDVDAGFVDFIKPMQGVYHSFFSMKHGFAPMENNKMPVNNDTALKYSKTFPETFLASDKSIEMVDTTERQLDSDVIQTSQDKEPKTSSDFFCSSSQQKILALKLCSDIFQSLPGVNDQQLMGPLISQNNKQKDTLLGDGSLQSFTSNYTTRPENQNVSQITESSFGDSVVHSSTSHYQGSTTHPGHMNSTPLEQSIITESCPKSNMFSEQLYNEKIQENTPETILNATARDLSIQKASVPNFLVPNLSHVTELESVSQSLPTFLTPNKNSSQNLSTPPKNTAGHANMPGSSPLSPSIYLSGQVPRHRRTNWSDSDMRPRGVMMPTVVPPFQPQTGPMVRQRLFAPIGSRGRGGRGRMQPKNNDDDDVIVTAVIRNSIPNIRQPTMHRGAPPRMRRQAPPFPRMQHQDIGNRLAQVAPQPRGAPPRKFDISKHFEDLACVVNAAEDMANPDDDDIQILSVTPAIDKEKPRQPQAVDASQFSYCCVHCGKDQGSRIQMKHHMKTFHNDSLIGAFTNVQSGRLLFFCPQLTCEFMTYDEKRLSEHLNKCYNLDQFRPFDVITAVRNLKAMKIRHLDVRSIGRSQNNSIHMDGQGLKDNFSNSLNDAFDDIVVNASGRHGSKPFSHPPAPLPLLTNSFPQRSFRPPSSHQATRARFIGHPSLPVRQMGNEMNRSANVMSSYPRMVMRQARGVQPRMRGPLRLPAPQIGGEQEPIVIDDDSSAPVSTSFLSDQTSGVSISKPTAANLSSLSVVDDVRSESKHLEYNSYSQNNLTESVNDSNVLGITGENLNQQFQSNTNQSALTHSSSSPHPTVRNLLRPTVISKEVEPNLSGNHFKPLETFNPQFTSVEQLDEEERIHAYMLEKAFAKVPNMPKTVSHRLIAKFKQYSKDTGAKITSSIIDEFVSKISYKGSGISKITPTTEAPKPGPSCVSPNNQQANDSLSEESRHDVMATHVIMAERTMKIAGVLAKLPLRNIDTPSSDSVMSNDSAFNTSESCDSVGGIAENFDNVSQIAENYDNVSQIAENYDNVSQIEENYDNVSQIAENYDNVSQIAENYDNVSQIAENYDSVSGITRHKDTVSVSENGDVEHLTAIPDVSENLTIFKESSDIVSDAVSSNDPDSFAATVNYHVVSLAGKYKHTNLTEMSIKLPKQIETNSTFSKLNHFLSEQQLVVKSEESFPKKNNPDKKIPNTLNRRHSLDAICTQQANGEIIRASSCPLNIAEDSRQRILKSKKQKTNSASKPLSSQPEGDIQVLFSQSIIEDDLHPSISLKDNILCSSVDPILINSSVDHLVFGHDDLEVDIAGKPDESSLLPVEKLEPHDPLNLDDLKIEAGNCPPILKPETLDKKRQRNSKVLPKLRKCSNTLTGKAKSIANFSVLKKRKVTTSVIDNQSGKLIPKITKRGRPRVKNIPIIKAPTKQASGKMKTDNNLVEKVPPTQEHVDDNKDESSTEEKNTSIEGNVIEKKASDSESSKDEVPDNNEEFASKAGVCVEENSSQGSEGLNSEIFVRRSDRKRKSIRSDYRGDGASDLLEYLDDDDEDYNIDDDDSDNENAWMIESGLAPVTKKKIKKIKPPPDPTAFDTSTKGKFKCWLCKKVFQKSLFAKGHLLKKHKEGLCSIDLLQTEASGVLHLLLYCVRDCKYATFELDGYNNHVAQCQKSTYTDQDHSFLDLNKTFIEDLYPELIKTDPKDLLQSNAPKDSTKKSKPKKVKLEKDVTSIPYPDATDFSAHEMQVPVDDCELEIQLSPHPSSSEVAQTFVHRMTQDQLHSSGSTHNKQPQYILQANPHDHMPSDQHNVNVQPSHQHFTPRSNVPRMFGNQYSQRRSVYLSPALVRPRPQSFSQPHVSQTAFTPSGPRQLVQSKTSQPTHQVYPTVRQGARPVGQSQVARPSYPHVNSVRNLRASFQSNMNTNRNVHLTSQNASFSTYVSTGHDQQDTGAIYIEENDVICLE